MTQAQSRQMETLRQRCEADQARRGPIDPDASFELDPPPRALQVAIMAEDQWEDWSPIATEEDADRAARLVARRPSLWRIV